MTSAMEPARGYARHRRLAVPAAIAAAAVGVGSAAWACVPSTPDKQTKISQCSAPSGSLKKCKTPIGAPTFPNATFVKGPSGSTLVAYVTGPGMGTSTARLYDLVFASKPQLDAGTPCASEASVELAGPVASVTGGGLPHTSGTIPANSPLGLGQVCFADVTRTQNSSIPASFKVTL